MKKSKFFLIPLVMLVFLPVLSQIGPGGVGYEDNSEDGQPELVLWLKADDLELTNGNTVEKWDDLSGNGHDAMKAGESSPIYEANKINGLPWIKFDGSSYFTVEEKTNIDGGPGITIFVVVKPDAIDAGGGMKLVSKRNHWNLWGAGLTKDICQYSFNLDFHGRDGNQYVMAHVNGNMPDNKVETESIYGDTSMVYLIDYKYNQNISEIRVNGTTNSGNKPNPNTGVSGVGNLEDYSNDVTIAAAYYDPPQEGEKPVGDFLLGNIAEIIIYREGLDSTRLFIVENYLATKYKLPLADHQLFSDETYTHELIGIGSEKGIHKHSLSSGGILSISEENSSIDKAGDYFFTAHNGAETEWIELSGSEMLNSYWSTEWKFTKTGSLDVKLSFNFSEAGSSVGDFTEKALLYRENPDEEYTILETPPAKKFNSLEFIVPNEQLNDGYYTIGIKKEQTSISKIINREREVLITPTLVLDHFQLIIGNAIQGEVKIRVLNTLGQVVCEKTYAKNRETLIKRVELQNMSPGLYFIELIQENHRFYKRIVKK